MLSSTLPLEKIQAEGSAYREASSNPTKPIVVIGVWLLFSPGAALFFYALFKIIAERIWSADIAWFLCYGAISVALLIKTTSNFIKKRKGRSGRTNAALGELVRKNRIQQIKCYRGKVDLEVDLDALRDRK